MLVDLISILNQYGASTVQQIRGNIQATGTTATGKTARSLRYEVTQQGQKFSFKVFGRPFVYSVETGRKSTPQYEKPSIQFVSAIREWARAKGVEEGAAYAIAKSIHQKGTGLFRKGGRQDIITPVVESLPETITKDLAKRFADQFLFNVIQTFESGRPIT